MLRAIALTTLTLTALAAGAQGTRPATQPATATTQPTTQGGSQPTTAPSAAGDLSPAEELAAATEAAHGAAAWRAHDAFATEISLTMGGQPRLEGTITMKTDLSRMRIDLNDGTTMIWDGENAWIHPPNPEANARFDVQTWPYFIAAPFKLRDPGTHLEMLGTQQHREWGHTATRLTFDEGVGDAPDDWYINYHCPGTDKLLAQAYIVTFFPPGDDGEYEPHAVEYTDFQTVDGVTLATIWDFVAWSEEQGPHGEPMGNATLSNLRFVSPPDALFSPPPGAVIDPLPNP